MANTVLIVIAAMYAGGNDIEIYVYGSIGIGNDFRIETIFSIEKAFIESIEIVYSPRAVKTMRGDRRNHLTTLLNIPLFIAIYLRISLRLKPSIFRVMNVAIVGTYMRRNPHRIV